MRYLLYFFIITVMLGLMIQGVSAAGTTAEAVLNINTPPAQILQADTQLAELARIDLTATNGALYLQGIQLGTDVTSGLSNFTEIIVYNASNNSVVGSYHSGDLQDVLQFSTITISNPPTKTFIIRGTPVSSAKGIVRVGFKNLTFGNSETVTQSNVPIYGNAVTLPGGAIVTPTPTPTPTPTSTPSPSSRPSATPVSRGFVSLAALNLREGDAVSATGSNDPDVYIVNSWGYKRLFLNPVIFGFYGHLGGFKKVKSIMPLTRDTLVTSGLFRNCETNDQQVYGVEVTGEDTGMLHWVNTSGAQAVQDDPDFFKRVFCINSKEFNWYSKGSNYTSVSQVRTYSR